MAFVDRQQELEVLNRALSASTPALFILYGRRRVGKTALLHRACSVRRHVFFTADLGSRGDQLASFAACLARDLREDELEGLTFHGWEEAGVSSRPVPRRRPWRWFSMSSSTWSPRTLL